ncbi:MAG: metallophosphoesterase [Gaiellaceae bacterium]
MRLALISDVHGNDVAFAAVVADLERVGCDGAVCLGDVAQGGPQPRETLDRLRALEGPVVIGNSDAFLLEVPADSPEPITGRQLAVREWTLAQLGAGDLAFIRSFSPTVELALDGAGLLAFHGSPRAYDDVLLPDSDAAALEPFRGTGADVLAGGHTHLQWTRAVDGALLVNPGSVGLAYDRHQPDHDFKLTPVAEYALLTAGTGAAAVEFRRVPYSLETLIEVTRASGRPDARAYLDAWRPA